MLGAMETLGEEVQGGMVVRGGDLLPNLALEKHSLLGAGHVEKDVWRINAHPTTSKERR